MSCFSNSETILDHIALIIQEHIEFAHLLIKNIVFLDFFATQIESFLNI